MAGRIKAPEHGMLVEAECPIAPPRVGTVSEAIMLSPEHTPFTRNKG